MGLGYGRRDSKIKNVWIKTIRAQPQENNTVCSVEFESTQAAKVYRDHPAHKEWEKQGETVPGGPRRERVLPGRQFDG